MSLGATQLASSPAPPWLQSNSLGFSCNQADYPGKSFKRHHAAMIHIPKTGGTSMGRWGDKSGYRFDKSDLKHRFVHNREPNGRDRASSTFRFSFVRNPYTRFVSQYTFCRSGAWKTFNRGFPCHLVDKHKMPFDDWWTHLLRSMERAGNGTLPSIHDKVNYQFGHFDTSGQPSAPGHPGHRQTPPRWCSGNWWGHCFGPVSQWIYADGHSGRRVVDWVGRLENFSTDFACLTQLLNDTLPGARAFRTDTKSFHVRNSQALPNVTRKSTREWMRNASLRSMVLKHWADDFDNFGYSRELP